MPTTTRRKPRPTPNPPFPAAAWALANRTTGQLGGALYESRDQAMAMFDEIKDHCTFDSIVELAVVTRGGKK